MSSNWCTNSLMINKAIFKFKYIKSSLGIVVCNLGKHTQSGEEALKNAARVKLSENSRDRKFRKCCEKVNAHKQSNLPSFWMKKPRVAINSCVLLAVCVCVCVCCEPVRSARSSNRFLIRPVLETLERASCRVFAWVLAVFWIVSGILWHFPTHKMGGD